MNAKLLQLIIASAGPNMAAALARAILGYLKTLADRTETDLDNDILEIIMRAISNTDDDQKKLEE